ncbi:hypothetical protein QP185_10135 [Sphingomonas aerolata]|uniref:hypothetical protein n=1 Tax=Sphingomonas aerolata TaxID=185951 RepID=UPI002FE37FF6
MRAIEEFVGGQERHVQPRAAIGIDLPPAEQVVDTAVDAASLGGRNRRAQRRQAVVHRGRERRLLARHERLRMRQHRLDRRAALVEQHRHREHAAPAFGRTIVLAASLEQFGQPDHRHEMPLVDRQRPLQRRALAGQVVAGAQRGRQIHVEPGRRRIRSDRPAEQRRRRGRPVARQRLPPEDVERGRMLPATASTSWHNRAAASTCPARCACRAMPSLVSISRTFIPTSPRFYR